MEWLNFLLCYLFDFVLLWSKNLIPVISILSYLLRFAFFFYILLFFLLEDVLTVLETNVYSAVVGWSIL